MDGKDLSSYPPTGKAERVSGGFRLTGRWSFSSGCDYARWAFLGAVVPSSRPTASAHDITAFLVPRRDYRIEDVWHVAGLAGTGSSDIVIDEAFVADYRATSFGDSYRQRLPGQADNPCPLFRLPLGPVFGYSKSRERWFGTRLGTSRWQDCRRQRGSCCSRG
jgi:3-hydroxy-9,10-secoandrosta-1,3,5(10)-triene-9,17-dione monooxygenase